MSINDAETLNLGFLVFNIKMCYTCDKKRNKKISAIKYSMLAILSVFIVEVSLGLAVGSLAIISDGAHALFDFITTFILFISILASSKPPDEDHMYGHEKFEYLGGMIGGFMLIILAVMIIFEASSKIIAGASYIDMNLISFGYIALAYTFIIDLTRIYVLSSAVGNAAPGIRADLYHALADLCSTLIAFLGFWLSSHGIFYGDSLASLILSGLLIFLSVRFVWSSTMELSDIAPREIVEKIKEQITKASGGLLTYENLKVRKVGDKVFARATLKVPDYVGFEEAHNVATRIENSILEVLRDADISFHIEPSGIKGKPTREFIREIVSEFEGIIDVHDIEITYHCGKAHVSLHIRVDPKMPLSRAHKVADEIERTIRASVKNIENVFVHIEPSSIELNRGSIISDEEMNNLVRPIIEKYGGKVKTKRIITYLADGKRRTNIECILDEDAPIEEAHKIALEIENKIKERVSESSVTVHVEPRET
ncbi:MAG: cation diffusion facilitator family transporter [Candidatus Bathyarchaeia archaeon]